MNTLTLRLPFPRAVPRGVLQYVLSALLVGGVYYVGCLIGFAVRFPSSGISFLWPPTAVLMAALLVTPRQTWLWLLAGSFVAHAVAHAQQGVPISAWPVQFAGNGVQAVIGAVVVRHQSRSGRFFSDLRGVTSFIVGASIAAPALASLIPAYVYVNMGWAPDFWQAWRARAVSNVVASLTLVPPLLVAYEYLRSTRRLPAFSRFAEFALLLLGLAVSHFAALQIERADAPALSLALYAPVPFLLWASVRFGVAGFSAALLAMALLTITSALRGHGPFVAATPAESVVAVQIFIGVISAPLMLIAGLLEEKRAEHQTLVEIERQNSAILRALPDLMFLQTRDGVYLNYYATDVGELFVPPAAFLGKNMRDILPADLAERFARAFRQARPDAPVVVDYTLVMPDGDTRYFEARVIAHDEDRILSIVRDTTERSRSEIALREGQQRYALATAAGSVGVWDVNLITGQLYVGPELKATLGYSNEEIPNLAGAWIDMVHPADLDELRSRAKAHLDGTTADFEMEHRLIHRDGSVRWVLTKGGITERMEGKVVRMMGTYTDVTQRRRTERALKQANAALARMGRITALAELTASIAHEVNQPLCAIVANANACLRWLDSGAVDADFRGALTDVVQDSHRASEIIRRTRELFTNRPVRKTAVNLNHVIGDVLQLVQGRLQRNGVQLETLLASGLPLVHADELQIQQVLLNLLANAMDAVREMTDERLISVRSVLAKGSVLVSVRDSGRGFHAQEVHRLFHRFYTTKPGGMGVGLAISRSIIQAHGGALWAVSNVRRGATFWFSIPVVKEADG